MKFKSETKIDPELFTEYMNAISTAINDQYFNLLIKGHVGVKDILMGHSLDLIEGKVILSTFYDEPIISSKDGPQKL